MWHWTVKLREHYASIIRHAVPSKGNAWIFYAGYILTNNLKLHVLSVECSIKLVARMRQMAARMARLLTDNKDPHGIASCLGVKHSAKKAAWVG